ncbi:hypothetical protein OAK35_02965 [Crocinitomicaceae bacterium]|nr:hypothetical protein [Crocinitomicaceae bacterium]
MLIRLKLCVALSLAFIIFQGCSNKEEGKQCAQNYLDFVTSKQYTSAAEMVDNESSMHLHCFTSAYELANDSIFGKLRTYDLNFAGAHNSSYTTSLNRTIYAFPVLLKYDSTEVLHQFTVVDRGKGFRIFKIERLSDKK